MTKDGSANGSAMAQPMAQPSRRRYNWRPDLPDYRDKHYTQAGVALPDRVDLRAYCSPVEDQGSIGSCTGNAIVGAAEFLELRAGAKLVDLSRLFVYFNERDMEGTVSQDVGASIRDGVKSLAKIGVCTEKVWPYRVRKFATRPPAAAYRDAATRKITTYMRVDRNLDTMRECLADGFPFVFGFSVYEAFESDAVAKTGKVPLPKRGEKLLGGHAVLAVGYRPGAMLFRNSWGASWGMAGYGWLPFEYFLNRGLSSDFWTIRK